MVTKVVQSHDDEEKRSQAFKKAGEHAGFRYKSLVELDADTKDTEVILDGNESLQKFLMDHEKEFGTVSKDRRGHRKKGQSEENTMQNTGLPHHPLLADTQRFDGTWPEESNEPSINPEAAEQLDEELKDHPELVNDPKLRMALEHRKQMKMQMSQSITLTPNK